MQIMIAVKNLSVALILVTFSTQLMAAGSDSSSSSSSSPKVVQALPANIKKLVDSEDYESAINALNDFIADESGNPDAWNYLGYSQRKTGLLDKSLVSYKKALKLDKKHLGANEYIGELYLMMDKPKKAKKHLKKLAKYCGDCEEYEELREAIEQYN